MPAECQLLSDKAYHRLAQLLRCIEQGRPWPDALQQATSAYLAKDPANATDPLAYRVLSLLPVLYRRWSAVRLRHLSDWIEEWRLPEMFAGIGGVGAADATWQEALVIELATAEGHKFGGAGIDLYKAFDMTDRDIVYEVMRRRAPRGVSRHLRRVFRRPSVQKQVGPRSGRTACEILRFGARMCFIHAHVRFTP